MPNSCAVLGCKNRQSKILRFFRFPAICTKPKFRELSLIRRNRWLTALQRDDINEKNARICSEHFISGSSAALKDLYNPDWVPSLNMGDPMCPKRQKYSSNAAKKEHAFADLFELIGDGTNNEKSTDDSDEYSQVDEEEDDEDDDEKEQDHNYSRNLIPENILKNFEEQQLTVTNESNNSSQEVDFCDTITDRFVQSNYITYEKAFHNNSDLDIDVINSNTVDKFITHNKNNYQVSDIHLNDPTNIFSKEEMCNKINEFDKMNGNTNFYSELNNKNVNINEKFNQLNEQLDNNLKQPLFYADIDIDNEKTVQTQEHNYSSKNLEIDNLVENSNSYNNINNLNQIVIFKPDTKEIGTQTCMSNNMFEYLVTEIANKNLIVQQQSNIIAEKNNKIGKLKLKLHKIRLELYHNKKRKKN